jgi:uncharacterized membrane protein (UPF0182 family)
MSALISASYDAKGQPKVEVLELPDQTVVPGPIQVHRLMVNNARISQDLTLLSRNGQATVLYGNLISLPLKNDILYVEPVYVKSTQANAPPLLQKVLMSYGDGSKVVLEDNLTNGLKALAELGKASTTNPGGNTGTPPPTTQPTSPSTTLPGNLAAAAADVDKAIENLRAAQKAGDFVAQGQALKALDDAMSRFQQAQGAGTATAGPSTAPSASGAPSPSAGG